MIIKYVVYIVFTMTLLSWFCHTFCSSCGPWAFCYNYKDFIENHFLKNIFVQHIWKSNLKDIEFHFSKQLIFCMYMRIIHTFFSITPCISPRHQYQPKGQGPVGWFLSRVVWVLPATIWLKILHFYHAEVIQQTLHNFSSWSFRFDSGVQNSYIDTWHAIGGKGVSKEKILEFHATDLSLFSLFIYERHIFKQNLMRGYLGT